MKVVATLLFVLGTLIATRPAAGTTITAPSPVASLEEGGAAETFDQLDIKPFQLGGPHAPAGKIYTAGHSDAYGDDTPPTRAFGYYFDPSGTTSNPGFNATGGSLPPSVKVDNSNGSYVSLYLSVLTSLSYWDGAGSPHFSSDAVPDGTFLYFQSPSGSAHFNVTPTSGAVGGFSLGTTGTASNTSFGGNIHQHTATSIETASGIGGPDGFYAFEVSLVLGSITRTGGVFSPLTLDETTRSDPFYLVFHQATPSVLYSTEGDPQLVAAIASLNASLVPEPSTFGLAIVGALALFCRLRRA